MAMVTPTQFMILVASGEILVASGEILAASGEILVASGETTQFCNSLLFRNAMAMVTPTQFMKWKVHFMKNLASFLRHLVRFCLKISPNSLTLKSLETSIYGISVRVYLEIFPAKTSPNAALLFRNALMMVTPTQFMKWKVHFIKNLASFLSCILGEDFRLSNI